MLYIIRHGKTDWNAEKKLQGSTDIPLNDEGREMAKKAQSEVSKIDFDVCYSSPLIRAKETAAILLDGSDTPILTDDRLLEMSFGDYEGISNTYENPEYPISVFFTNPENYTPVGGSESLESLYGRTKNFIDEVIFPDLQAGKKVLIVGHGAMNCSLINQIKNIPIENFWQEMTGNCELKKIDL